MLAAAVLDVNSYSYIYIIVYLTFKELQHSNRSRQTSQYLLLATTFTRFLTCFMLHPDIYPLQS